MSIKKVWVEDECIACGLCVDICPEVFEMEDIATVIKGVNFDNYKEGIIEAAENCPVDVIKYTE